MRSSVFAAAASAILPVVSGQKNWTIDYWKDAQYSGDHVRRTMPVTACADLPGGWNDAISSAKIGWGCRCTFYSNAGCHDVAPIDFRRLFVIGPTDLPDFVLKNFNDVASSIRCEEYWSDACAGNPPPAGCSNFCMSQF
ncbi:hypothetical protein F5Y17DRAFT_27257 [Xylariaceae sp. FL0594]|nr:hypothetical protein F5Y17DRAFT_27257 [Xylariaceae sp. FL0594]